MKRVLVGMAIWLAFADSTRAESPDPMALLHGIRASRADLRGVLELHIVITSRYRPAPYTATYRVDFDGDKRTTLQRSIRTFVPSRGAGKLAKSGSSSPDELVKSGKAFQKETDVKFAWDGNRLLNYWVGTSTAGTRNPAHGTSSFSFDPRLFGLDVYFSPAHTLELSLFLGQSEGIQLQGRDTIRGREVWRVHVDRPSGCTFDFWVEDQAPFRVHQVEFTDDHESARLDCVYGGEVDGPLPSSLTATWFDEKGRQKKRTVMGATKLELGEDPVEDVGEMASLGLPVGTEVYDSLAGKRLGYWNGDGLSETKPGAMVESIEIMKREASWWGRNIYWLVSTGLLLCGAAAIWYVRRRRAASAA